MKEKIHTVSVKVRFNIAISRSEAVAEFRDIIHGEFFPGGYSGAETMIIGTVKSHKES